MNTCRKPMTCWTLDRQVSLSFTVQSYRWIHVSGLLGNLVRASLPRYRSFSGLRTPHCNSSFLQQQAGDSRLEFSAISTTSIFNVTMDERCTSSIIVNKGEEKQSSYKNKMQTKAKLL